MNDDERTEIADAVAAKVLGAIAELSTNVAAVDANVTNTNNEVRLLGMTLRRDIKKLEDRADDTERRVATVEQQVLGGVHHALAANDTSPHRVPALSVTSEVRESIRVQADRTDRVEKKADSIVAENSKQTTMLQTIASAQADNTRKAVAVFIGIVIATIWGQCQPSIPFLSRAPTYAPPPGTASPAPLPPR